MEILVPRDCSGDDLLSIFRRKEPHLKIRIESNTCLELTEMITLKANNAVLEIIGEGDGDERPVINCSDYSCFKVQGRRPTLNIKNIKLVHTCTNAPPAVGACIFGLYLSKIILEDCILESSHGFGLWLVQQSNTEIKNCSITSTSRSGIACFGQAKLNIFNTLIYNCKIHSVCARGDTKIILKNCELKKSGKRGIYAYHRVDLAIDSCVIHQTMNKDYFAIDLWSCDDRMPTVAAEEKRLRNNGNESEIFIPKLTSERIVEGRSSMLKFTMLHTTVSDNSGSFCRIREGADNKVLQNIENCNIFGNLNDEIVYITDEAVSVATSSAAGYGWKYGVDDDDSAWKKYDESDCNLIESKYQDFLSDASAAHRFQLQHPHEHYEINLRDMTQTNLNSFFMRIIKRDKVC
jgi:hypothetical protein